MKLFAQRRLSFQFTVTASLGLAYNLIPIASASTAPPESVVEDLGAYASDRDSVETFIEQEGQAAVVPAKKRGPGGPRTVRIREADNRYCVRFFSEEHIAAMSGYLSPQPRYVPPPSERLVLYSVWRVDGNGARKFDGQFCDILPVPSTVPANTTSQPLTALIRERADLPPPVLGLSPAQEGLTGHGTRLWATLPPVVVTPRITVDGKSVQAEARPSRFLWSMGDEGTSAPQSTYETSDGGSSDRPAVTHVYETSSVRATGTPNGSYTVSLTVSWSGRYRVLGLADPCNDWCPLDGLETSVTRPYTVSSAVAVLCEGDGCAG
jgi:hypothetical protein